jgi:hypothetical protein
MADTASPVGSASGISPGVCVCVYTHVCVCVCVYVCRQVCVDRCVCACVRACDRVYVRTCVHACVYMRTCVCVSACVYACACRVRMSRWVFFTDHLPSAGQTDKLAYDDLMRATTKDMLTRLTTERQEIIARQSDFSSRLAIALKFTYGSSSAVVSCQCVYCIQFLLASLTGSA